MKKIFIIAYSKENLGDDLFIDILVNKYKNIEFYTRAIKEGTYINQKNNNLHYVDYQLDDILKDDDILYDAYVYIGGSIFMEHAGGVERIKKLKEIAIKLKKANIPYIYISSNYGPYSTVEYKKVSKELFENITDICFRDKKSYQEFQNIKSVRYAPDLVLSFDREYITQKNTVGISVINFKFREDLRAYESKYYGLIKNSIVDYIKRGKEVTLFSFCKYEGDEETVKILLNSLSPEYLDKIKVENYRGDMDEFLKKYSSMEYCICSRFHAMILSAVFNQKALILSYSNKINNVIEDLKLCSDYINIRDIEDMDIIDLDKFAELKVSNEIKEDATKQFYGIEEVLKR